MESEGSLPCSQKPATCVNPESEKLSTRPPILFLYDPFQYYPQTRFDSQAGIRDYSLVQSVQTGSEAHNSFSKYRGSFCEIKRPRSATDNNRHLVPKLRMIAAVSLLAHMPS